MTHTKHHEEPALAFLARLDGSMVVDLGLPAYVQQRAREDFIRDVAHHMAEMLGRLVVEETQAMYYQKKLSLRATLFLDTEEADRMPSHVTLTPITYTHEKP